MARSYKFKAVCLLCGHSETVHHPSKEGYKEVMVCPKCKEGVFVDSYRAHVRKQQQSNEIEIYMSTVNDPPKIKLNGKDIDGIVSLDYKYVTSDCDSRGYHNFTVKYYDKITNTIHTVSANKIGEG